MSLLPTPEKSLCFLMKNVRASCACILSLIFPRSNGHSVVMRIGILQNDQGCQCTTTVGECRGGYDLWRRMCMYQKMWFVETAGSEQTSPAIMLWAKRRVYVCSGRAGGNERHLWFFVRYVEPWHPPHPNPASCVACNMCASARNVNIPPTPTQHLA